MNLTVETVAATFAMEMSSAAKLVYFALVHHANITEHKAWPSRALLARETGLGVTSVSKAISELCRRELIVRRKSLTGNIYIVQNMNVRGTPDVQPSNATCTTVERQAFTNIRKNISNEHKKEPPPKAPPGLEGAFEEFWKEYPDSCPRKVDKAKCRAKYTKCRAEAADPAAFDAECLAALRRWKASDLWTKNGGSFIRAPLVWLNSRSWEDTPKAAVMDTAGAFRTGEYTLRLGAA